MVERRPTPDVPRTQGGRRDHPGVGAPCRRILSLDRHGRVQAALHPSDPALLGQVAQQARGASAVDARGFRCIVGRERARQVAVELRNERPVCAR